MTSEEQQKPAVTRPVGGVDLVYGIGMIGAWVFYFSGAATNQQRFTAVLKGLVWPAILVYDLLTFLEKE